MTKQATETTNKRPRHKRKDWQRVARDVRKLRRKHDLSQVDAFRLVGIKSKGDASQAELGDDVRPRVEFLTRCLLEILEAAEFYGRRPKSLNAYSKLREKAIMCRAARDTLDLTSINAGKLVGVTNTIITRFERGHTNFYDRTINKLFALTDAMVSHINAGHRNAPSRPMTLVSPQTLNGPKPAGAPTWPSPAAEDWQPRDVADIADIVDEAVQVVEEATAALNESSAEKLIVDDDMIAAVLNEMSADELLSWALEYEDDRKLGDLAAANYRTPMNQVRALIAAAHLDLQISN